MLGEEPLIKSTNLTKSRWQSVAGFVRVFYRWVMPIDKAKQRARWKRNKQAQRNRERLAKPKLQPIDPQIEASVWVERDRRLRNFPWWIWDLKEKRFYPRQTRAETYPFICDVWAAITLLETQTQGSKITNVMIGEFLWVRGKRHGVKKASFRTKIPRAKKIIGHLEEAPALDFRGAYWPKFPGRVAEHGSGLKQHVHLVMKGLGSDVQ